MPKWKAGDWAGAEPDAAGGGFTPYDGPALPFSGVFPFVVKTIKMKENKNKDDMLFMVLECHAPEKDDDKFKWHGAPLFVNLNQTEQSAPFTMAMLDAFGISWKAFTTKTILGDEDPPTVVKLGGVDVVGRYVKVSLKKGKGTAQYPAKGEVGAWIPWAGPDDDDDYEQDADDDESAPF